MICIPFILLLSLKSDPQFYIMLRLFSLQQQEIMKNRDPFDGHAVDMWAVGVILFLMLTGFPPWERACRTDER